MNYLKRLQGVLCVAIISALSFSSIAKVQSAEQYVNVGSDSNGDPFLLDTATMGRTDEEFGKTLKLYQIKNNLMKEILIDASCGDNRLWIVGVRTYSENGVMLSEDKVRQEVNIQSNSVASKSISYYCRSIGARGW